MIVAIDVATEKMLQQPQAELVTEHLFHGGMYARTIRLAAGAVLAGTLIVIPTLLIVHGDASVLIGDEWVNISGYNVFPGSAGRKQVFVTHSAVEMTMVFPTKAQSVEIAEAEFTDEYDRLLSRKNTKDQILVTGE